MIINLAEIPWHGKLAIIAVVILAFIAVYQQGVINGIKKCSA